jgi:hypothetical protein
VPGQAGSREYEQARLSLAYAASAVVLDGQGRPVSGTEEMGGEQALLTKEQEEAKDDGSAVRFSRNVCDRHELTKALALQAMCAHREVCTRMANLLRDRIVAVKTSFGWM